MSAGVTTQAYDSTADAAAIAERLSSASRVAVLTHTKPDGDAVGSVLGLARALQHRGVHAHPVFCEPWNGRFDPVVRSTPIVVAGAESDFERAELREADAVAVVDTGSFGQLGVAAGYVRERFDRTLIIDHHRGGESSVAPMRLIDVEAASATQIVARVATALCGAESPAGLPRDVAEPLYLGLATDTGWFKHPSVTPAVFRLAADLLEAGVDHNELYTVSDMSDPPSRLLLMQRALGSLELVSDGRLALMSLDGEDFRASGAEVTDASGLIDVPKSVRTVEVSALLYAVEPGVTKLSLRSKRSALSIDVNELASVWGGGGHHHAAGAKLRLDVGSAVEEVRSRLVNAIEAAASESAKRGL